MTPSLRQASMTVATVADRLGPVRKSPSLPLALLLLALFAMFLFGNDRGHFYRDGHHDWISSQSMTLAANLSADHNFLMFLRQIPDPEEPGYDAYNRFPVGTYAAIKLAILPFGDDLSAKIYVARLLMLLFFAGTAVLAYLALCRLTSNRWVALAATLLAFASSYALYYNDMVSTEITSLFGVLLVFHGMVIFEQEGRFRQLLVKSCIALLLGWHVFALLLPFILFGVGRGIVQARAAHNPPSFRSWLRRQLSAARPAAIALLSNRYLVLGFVSLAFGFALLGFNLGSEYRAYDGETRLTELPTYNSMLYRIGADEKFNEANAEGLAWPNFLRGQFASIGIMSVPFALPGWTSTFNVNAGVERATVGLPSLFLGIGVFCGCLIGLFFVRHKLLTATLILAGFFWTLPMRHSSFWHDFEALFYIGIPLVFFSLVLMYAHKHSNGRLMASLAVVAALVFVFSAFQMGRVGHDAKAAELQAEVIADFEVIRGITQEKSVHVFYATWDPKTRVEPGEGYLRGNYYLSGRPLEYGNIYKTGQSDRHLADFLITRERADGPALLTPENRRVFLYDRANYDRRLDEIIEQAGEPALRSTFDVYLNEGRLIYVKDPCAPADTEAMFFLHLHPVDVHDLPDYRQQHGFHNLDFDFSEDGAIIDGKCTAVRSLPEYDIARISTGQYVPLEEGGFHHFWEGEFPWQDGE